MPAQLPTRFRRLPAALACARAGGQADDHYRDRLEHLVPGDWLPDGRMVVTGEQFVRVEPDGSVRHANLGGVTAGARSSWAAPRYLPQRPPLPRRAAPDPSAPRQGPPRPPGRELLE